MFCGFRIVVLCTVIICAAVGLGAAGCSRQYYKDQADKETYEIIDSKWRDDFGEKANYRLSVPASAENDIDIVKEMPESSIITLTQAVAIATNYNRNYQDRKESLYLSALDLTSTRHKYARQWFGTFDASYNRNIADESIGTDSKLGFNQLLAGGAQISANIALDWVRFLTGDPRTSLGSVLYASISQPLLRGAGRKIAQENLTQAERDVLYQIRSFNRFRKTFVVSIVNDYYRVLQQKDKVTNAENNYKRRMESKERLEMEALVGRKPHFEVDQAEQNVLTARDSYIRSKQEYEQRLDEFKIRLSLPTDFDIKLSQDELAALRQVGVTKPDYPPADAIETALLRRLDLANTADSIDDSLRKAMVAADNLGAELNLIGSLDVDSTEKTQFERLRFHEGSYGFGLESDLPLDRKDERNAYRKALIAIEQRQREYDRRKDEVKLEVMQAYRQLIEAAESYSIQSRSLELARRRVEMTSLLLEDGRARTRDLLEAQDDLLVAENSLTTALIDYTIEKLSFFRDVGILQIRPDGMWKKL